MLKKSAHRQTDKNHMKKKTTHCCLVVLVAKLPTFPYQCIIVMTTCRRSKKKLVRYVYLHTEHLQLNKHYTNHNNCVVVIETLLKLNATN